MSRERAATAREARSGEEDSGDSWSAEPASAEPSAARPGPSHAPAALFRLSLAGERLPRLFFTVFASVSVIPPLAFWYVAEQYGIARQGEVLGLLAMTALLSAASMLLVWRTLRSISRLRDELVAQRGDPEPHLQELTAQAIDAVEVVEIQQILAEFNQLLRALKENTQTLERIVFQSTTLSDLTELTSSISDIKELLRIVLKKTMRGVDADTGSIMILESDRGHLTIAAAQGLDPEVVEHTRAELGDTIAGRVLAGEVPVLVPDVAHDRSFQSLSRSGTGSFISLPMKVRGRPIGVINVAKTREGESFNSNDLRFLTTLLNHIGFAVENARLLEEATRNVQKLAGALHDTTSELDRTKRHMADVERLTVVGDLASGVARELNKPLGVLLRSAQVLLLEPRIEDDVRKTLATIHEQAVRAKHITQNLVRFARQHPLEPESVDLHELVDRAVEFVGYEMQTAEVTLRKDYDPAVPRLRLDPHQMSEVIVNLILNAYQALREKRGPGELHIATRLLGDRVALSFRDTGPGIGETQLEKIFDPFFTTKDLGKGTGLGLSVSYAIVQEHHGRIYAENAPGGGARFVIELPVAAEERALAPGAAAAEGGGRRILVVGDESNVADLLRASFEAENLEVHAEAETRAALDALRARDYDLVIGSLKNPAIEGRRLYGTIASESRLARYRRRVVFVAGETLGRAAKSFLEENQLVCLSKPFLLEDLRELVRKALTA